MGALSLPQLAFILVVVLMLWSTFRPNGPFIR